MDHPSRRRGGASPEALAELRRREEQWLEDGRAQETQTARYFEQARTILQDAGVPPSHIRARMTWDTNSVSEAVLAELAAGDYSAVIVGRHHHDLFSQLLGGGLADTLRWRLDGVTVCIVDDVPGSAAPVERQR